MKMNREEKARFDRLVIDFCAKAETAFKKKGRNDFDDLSQEVALRLSAARLPEFKGGFSKEAVEAYGVKIANEVFREARSRERGEKLMDLASADNVADVSTPHHFVAAGEIAYYAERLDLDSFMMGDTLQEEAEYHGVTRQCIHQRVTYGRQLMNEFLVD